MSEPICSHHAQDAAGYNQSVNSQDSTIMQMVVADGRCVMDENSAHNHISLAQHGRLRRAH